MQGFGLAEYVNSIERLPRVALFETDGGNCAATKAGVLPFITEEKARLYLLMRPLARKPEAGPPPFQIAKGSRLAYVGGRWEDSKNDNTILNHPEARENIHVTALREGVEELGLNLAKARRMYLGMEFPFTSASTGITKQVWVNAIEMEGRDCLLSMDLADTAEVRWMSLPEIEHSCRVDHAPIVKAIDKALEASISR